MDTKTKRTEVLEEVLFDVLSILRNNELIVDSQYNDLFNKLLTIYD